MKKILLPVICAFAIAFSTVSCKKDGEQASQSSVTIQDENEANNIIEFNNKYIEMDRRYRSNVDRLVDFSDKALRKMQGDRFVIANATIMPSMNRLKEVPKIFGKEQTEMENIFAEQQKVYTSILEKKDEMQAYLKAEDFKDDKGEKGNTLAKEIVGLADQYYTTSLKFSEKLKPIADDAETIILKDHPLKDHIIGSKKVLSTIEDAYSLVIEQYNNETFNATKINEVYTKIESELKNNKDRGFSVKDENYTKKESNYNLFNKEVESFLGTLRKLNRDSETSKNISESQVRAIESAYNSVISDYNYFVN